MTTEKYEQLRQKIIEANPEIMELKFGCEVVPEIDTNEIMKVFKIGTGLFGTKVWVTCKDTMDTVYLPEELKIIGRSIRLADVLLALQKLADDDENRHWCVNRCGEFVKELVPPLPYHGVKVGEKWDPKDDNLDSQPDETLEFLVNILSCSEFPNS